MIYIALLRGVNVGGKGTVSMATLKAVFEDLGFTDVRTYINSGNVIFISKQRDTQALAGQIEQALDRTFSPGIKVLVKTHKELKDIAGQIPPSWVNDTSMRCDVMFLWPAVDRPESINELPANPELEDIRYTPGAIIWRIDRTVVTKSRMTRIIGSPLYRQMTARNVNTTRKLIALANELN